MFTTFHIIDHTSTHKMIVSAHNHSSSNIFDIKCKSSLLDMYAHIACISDNHWVNAMQLTYFKTFKCFDARSVALKQYASNMEDTI